jgi:SPP1 family predicted phage head-tail adaptor
VKAGLLDRRIVVQSKSNSTDSYGFRSWTWTTHATIWANWVHNTGNETDKDKNKNTDVSGHFRTRYVSTIDENMRIIYNSEYYKIVQIKEIQRQDGLLIYVEKLQQT